MIISSGWVTSTNATIAGIPQEGCHIEYNLNNGSDWEQYGANEKIKIEHSGETVKARYSDGKNTGTEASPRTSTNVDDQDPTAKIISTAQTTKSITVNADGSDEPQQGDSASGVNQYQFTCIKPDGKTETTAWTNNKNYKFDNINYGSTGAYQVKVKVKDLSGRESKEVTGSGNLEKLTTQNANIKFQATPGATQWTNDKVKVTITTDKKDVTLQYATQWNGSQPAYQDYSGQQIEVEKQNTEVLARLTDGTNTSTDSATCKIANIDKIEPGVQIEADDEGESAEIIGAVADADATPESRKKWNQRK